MKAAVLASRSASMFGGAGEELRRSVFGEVIGCKSEWLKGDEVTTVNKCANKHATAAMAAGRSSALLSSPAAGAVSPAYVSTPAKHSQDGAGGRCGMPYSRAASPGTLPHGISPAAEHRRGQSPGPERLPSDVDWVGPLGMCGWLREHTCVLLLLGKARVHGFANAWHEGNEVDLS